MAEINYQEELEKQELYKLAATLGMDLKYTPKDKDELEKALSEIKDAIKKRQQDEKQKLEDEQALKDKPDLQKEYQNIEKEGKPAAEAERETLNVEDKKVEEAKEAELSWVDAKKKFWAEFAVANALAANFANPEEDKSPVYCKLSKDDKQEGIVSYTSPNNAQISKDSGFKLYQGLVKDAIENELSITIGKSLDETQQLMLYAAVLATDLKYKSGEKPQVIGNLPVLSADLINSDTFKNLPDEAKNVLLAEAKRLEVEEKLKSIRGKLKQDIKDNTLSTDQRYALRQEELGLMHEQLSPEKAAERKAKEEERDKIMAARLGIIPEYRTKTLNGTDRVVQKDKELFNADGKLNESRVSKEQFDALMARQKEFEGK